MGRSVGRLSIASIVLFAVSLAGPAFRAGAAATRRWGAAGSLHRSR